MPPDWLAHEYRHVGLGFVIHVFRHGRAHSSPLVFRDMGLDAVRAHPLLADAELTPLTVALDWPPGTPPPDLGAWRLVAGPGDGSAEQPALQLPDGLPLRLAPARGGERLALNGCHQRVAELWRAAGVPPWRRRQWPLVYAGDDLVAVPGVAVADPWRDQPLTTWHLEPAS